MAQLYVIECNNNPTYDHPLGRYLCRQVGGWDGWTDDIAQADRLTAAEVKDYLQGRSWSHGWTDCHAIPVETRAPNPAAPNEYLVVFHRVDESPLFVAEDESTGFFAWTTDVDLAYRFTARAAKAHAQRMSDLRSVHVTVIPAPPRRAPNPDAPLFVVYDREHNTYFSQYGGRGLLFYEGLETAARLTQAEVKKFMRHLDRLVKRYHHGTYAPYGMYQILPAPPEDGPARVSNPRKRRAKTQFEQRVVKAMDQFALTPPDYDDWVALLHSINDQRLHNAFREADPEEVIGVAGGGALGTVIHRAPGIEFGTFHASITPREYRPWGGRYWLVVPQMLWAAVT